MKKNRKGFTLVELIVVLVILAILIALLVPSLVGYIDKAKTKDIEAQAKLVLTAAQTIGNEEYARGAEDSLLLNNTSKLGTDISGQSIEKLGEVVGKYDINSTVTFDLQGKVSKLTYISKSGDVTVTYDAEATPQWKTDTK